MSSTKNFWSEDDFNVFTINGLENRMHALQTKIQPKFHQLGAHFAAKFSAEGGDEFFPHVAKHARRTVNPPADSWVAMAPSKRGYKALPHFQIGLWESHLFMVVAVIYENPDKKGIAERFLHDLHSLQSLPTDFIVSGDHMKPEASNIQEIGTEGLQSLLTRLQTVKKAEFLVGRHISKEDAAHLTEEQFMAIAEETFDALIPIYNKMIAKTN